MKPKSFCLLPIILPFAAREVKVCVRRLFLLGPVLCTITCLACNPKDVPKPATYGEISSYVEQNFGTRPHHVLDAMKARTIAKGMTCDEIIMLWGPPYDLTDLSYEGHVYRWIYYDMTEPVQVVVLEDGLVINWKDYRGWRWLPGPSLELL